MDPYEMVIVRSDPVVVGTEDPDALWKDRDGTCTVSNAIGNTVGLVHTALVGNHCMMYCYYYNHVHYGHNHHHYDNSLLVIVNDVQFETIHDPRWNATM